MESLVKELSRGAAGMTLVQNTERQGLDGTPLTADVTVRLRDLGRGWCHLEMCGNQKGTSNIMDFLTRHESIDDLLVWDFDLKRKEYSYSLFRKGGLEEQFSVKGPALDAVNFVSNIRRVELEDLMDGLDFSLGAIESFGIRIGESPPKGKEVVLEFFLPPPRPLWKKLLGSLSGTG